MNFPFFKEEIFGLRKQVTFTGNTCEIYIPQYFFNKNDMKALATDLGERIRTIGLFFFKVDNELHELQLPISMEFQFSSVEKRRFKIKPNIPDLDYFVYTLKNGDAFMYNRLHKRDVGDIKIFISKLIEGAKLPPYISYADSLNIFLRAMVASKNTGLDISGVSIEFMLSEIYRYKGAMSDPFRLHYNGKNPYDFKMIRLTKVPQLNSTFTGLTGEDINTQLVSAIVKTREGGEDKETPIEKVIKY